MCNVTSVVHNKIGFKKKKKKKPVNPEEFGDSESGGLTGTINKVKGRSTGGRVGSTVHEMLNSPH
jgi:hypothetical protein